ncbi:hypothetical protein [Streptomyces hygroscopicus]|uniref:hypothetical protein n=1 Tax=Streptomyces hygroscopicus TaxID=1912 RepID=UPI001FCB81AD|nr:hypothetical protein [Streptomyces hygroscopicus]BDH09978.1 hypothetical protein HOK021_11570 [Streptomyces hygroscopicus]
MSAGAPASALPAPWRTAGRGSGRRRHNGLCSPYGTVGARTVVAVYAADYGSACALGPGSPAGPRALPRFHIGIADTPWRLHLTRAPHPLRRRALPLDETTTPAATPGGIR